MTPEQVAAIMWLLGLLALYFVPSIVAHDRGHHQKAAIIILNIFLGWTMFGWVAALVWSATAVRKGDTPTGRGDTT